MKGKLVKECLPCRSEEYTGDAPCSCVYEVDITAIKVKNKEELFKVADILEGIDIPVFSSPESKEKLKDFENYILVFHPRENAWGVQSHYLGEGITIGEFRDAIINHRLIGPFGNYIETKKLDKAVKETCEYMDNIPQENPTTKTYSKEYIMNLLDMRIEYFSGDEEMKSLGEIVVDGRIINELEHIKKLLK